MGGVVIDPKDLAPEQSGTKGSATVEPAPVTPAPTSNFGTVVDAKDLGGKIENPIVYKSAQTEPSPILDQVKRQAGLAARTYGPYAAASAAGGLLGTEFGPPGMLAGAIAGPTLLGLTDLSLNAYNAVGNGLFGLPRATTGSEYFNKLADKAGLPTPSTTAEKIADIGGQSLLSTGSNIATATKMAPTIASPVIKNVVTQAAQAPGSQLVASVTGPAAATVAQDKLDIQNPYALLGINLGGAVAGGAGTSRLSNVNLGSFRTPSGNIIDINPAAGTNYANQETGALVQNARARGVDLNANDVAPGSMGGKAINSLRRYAGTSEQRAGETTNQVINAIENTTENARPASVPVGTSADRAVANDLRTQYGNAKDTAGKMYDAVETALAKDPGSEKMIPAATQDIAASLKADFPDWATLTNASQSTANKINSILKGVGQDSGAYTGVGGGVKTTDFKDMRALSKEVGQLVEATRTDPKLAMVHGKLKALYGAIQTDFDSWATTTGNKQAADAYDAAQTFFKDNVAPFRDNPNVYRIVSSRTPTAEYDKYAENIVNRTLQGGVEPTQLTTSLLSPEGNNAFRFKMLEDARSRSINPDNATLFSAPGYMREMGLGRPDTPSPARVAFGTSPTALQDVSQLGQIVDTTRGAVVPKVPPKTGYALLPSAVTAGETTAGATMAHLMGFDPVIGGVIGAVASPTSANLIDRALSNRAATDFILGNRYRPGFGLLNPGLTNIKGEQ